MVKQDGQVNNQDDRRVWSGESGRAGYVEAGKAGQGLPTADTRTHDGRLWTAELGIY